ncbi:MAG: hypothetical protein ACPLQP_04520 [Moorellaceae bacterium]
MIEAFSEIFKFSANVLGNLHDPLNRLIVLDFLLYTFVSAAGPLWQCSAVDVQWSCPPRCLIPVLNLLRKIFSWPDGNLGLSESLAVARSQLNGPGSLMMAFLGVFLLMILDEDGMSPVPVNSVIGGGGAYGVLWIVALILGCGSLLLLSRNVIRNLICVEYVLAVGKNDSNDTQGKAGCNQEHVQEHDRDITQDFGQATNCALVFPSCGSCSEEGTPKFDAIRAGAETIPWQDQCPGSGKAGEKEFRGTSKGNPSSVEGGDQGDDYGNYNAAAIAEYASGFTGGGRFAAIKVSDKTAEEREQADDTQSFNGYNSISGNVWAAHIKGGNENMCCLVDNRMDKKEDVNVGNPSAKDEPLRWECGDVLCMLDKKFHWSFLLFPVILLFTVFPLLRAKVESVGVNWGRKLVSAHAVFLVALLVPFIGILVFLLGLMETVYWITIFGRIVNVLV